jgi:hypothetical protein
MTIHWAMPLGHIFHDTIRIRIDHGLAAWHLLEMFLRIVGIGGFQLWIGEAHACQSLR